MSSALRSRYVKGNREDGSALVMVLFLSLVLGGTVLISLQNSRVAWADVDARHGAERTLQEAIGELSLAQYQIRTSPYTNGRNDVLARALAGDGLVEGTSVVAAQMVGVPATLGQGIQGCGYASGPG